MTDRTSIQAQVVLDSTSPRGVRLTTFELTYPRYMHAELMTHRVLSRNSESSRAVPLARKLDVVEDAPVMPILRSKRKGMQGGDDLDESARVEAYDAWLDARNACANAARRMVDAGVHKSNANRLIEPFAWHTVVVTATEWDGFFLQRDHPDALPEFAELAARMREAMDESRPDALQPTDWHLPYVRDEDVEEARERASDENEATQVLKRVSAARCARVSYVPFPTPDEPAPKRNLDSDLELFKKLTAREDPRVDPVHWSPLEHVATPCTCHESLINTPQGIRIHGKWVYAHRIALGHAGNLRGWDQFRHEHGDRSPYVRA